ncbi:MAG: glycosyltransferase, partial [Bacteroidia bacterium]
LGIEPGRFVLLQYGLFKEYKGLDRLAAALLQLPGEQRPLLVLAGGGPAEHLASVQRRIVDGGRGDCLLWLQRFVSDDELCGLVQIADLVLFPYVKVSQSGALWLAMTFGKPCLCHDLPGFRGMLPADEAFFVDAANPVALARRIDTLMRQPEELARLRGEIERWTVGAAGWSRIAEQSWAMYREARGS